MHRDQAVVGHTLQTPRSSDGSSVGLELETS